MSMSDARRYTIQDKWTQFLERHPKPSEQHLLEWLKLIKHYCDDSMPYDGVEKAARDWLAKYKL